MPEFVCEDLGGGEAGLGAGADAALEELLEFAFEGLFGDFGLCLELLFGFGGGPFGAFVEEEAAFGEGVVEGADVGFVDEAEDLGGDADLVLADVVSAEGLAHLGAVVDDGGEFAAGEVAVEEGEVEGGEGFSAEGAGGGAVCAAEGAEAADDLSAHGVDGGGEDADAAHDALGGDDGAGGGGAACRGLIG